MKRKVTALCAAMLAIVAASHVVVEAAGLRFFQPAADESIRTLEVFRSSGRRVDIALLGSSRVRRAVIVPVLEQELTQQLGRPVTAFNLGLQAGTVPSSYVVARDLLAREQRPALILLGLGARSMSSNSPRYHRTVRHLLAPGDLLSAIGPRLTASELGAVPLALIRAPGILLQLWRKLGDDEEAATILERGGSVYHPDPTALEVTPPEATQTADLAAVREKTAKRAALARDSLLVDFDPTGRATIALERLARLSREREITLLAVNLPVTAEYAGAAYTRGEYKVYLDHLRALCAREQIHFVDLNVGLPTDAALSHDGDHLSRFGATVFSRLVARTVLAPMLAD